MAPHDQENSSTGVFLDSDTLLTVQKQIFRKKTGFSLMQIEQNEVYEKVRTMFISGGFQTTRGRHCFLYLK